MALANDLQISLDSNIDQIKKEFRAVARDIEDKAALRALNRAGDQAITAASREIRARYNIKAAAVKSQIKIKNRAQAGNLSFAVRVFSKRIPLIEFAARKTARGVTVTVLKGSGRKLVTHTFIATMMSGHEGVFVRSSKSSGISGGRRQFRVGKRTRIRPSGQSDLPIAELFTASLPQMFLQKSVRAAVAQVVEESFVRNFRQQLTFLTGPS